MTRPAFALVLATFALAQAPAHARGNAGGSDDNELNLAVGEQKVLNAQGVVSYSEGVAGVIQVKVPEDGRRLVVTAVRPGSTTLLLIYGGNRQDTYFVNVVARSPAAVIHELQTLTADLHLDIHEAGGRVFIDGGVPSADDVARLDRIVAIYGGQVASLVVIDPSRQRKMIKLILSFVQFRKNVAHTAGIRWPGNFGVNTQGLSALQFMYTFDFVQRAATQAQAVVTADLFPSLDLLGIRGWAKVLSTATVITTNGGTAEYHSGGEVNVSVSGLGSASLNKIRFGTDIVVTPRFDDKTQMVVVKIDVDQSQLNPIAGQPIPGRLNNTTKTSVQCKLGDSIALMGFRQTVDKESASGIPLLMRIPILGYLFRSEQANTDNEESVLFITPLVDENLAAEKTKALEEAVKRFEIQSLDKQLKSFENFDGQPDKWE